MVVITEAETPTPERPALGKIFISEKCFILCLTEQNYQFLRTVQIFYSIKTKNLSKKLKRPSAFILSAAI